MKRSTTLICLMLAMGATGIALLWLLGGGSSALAEEADPVRSAASVDGAPNRDSTGLPRVAGTARVGPEAIPGGVGAMIPRETEPFEGAIEGWLVAKDSGAPLAGWTVEANPVGRPRSDDLPDADRWTAVTDGEGRFRLGSLDRRGPWDLWAQGVGAGFIDPFQGRYQVRPQRVGTLMASPPGEADPGTYPAHIGPVIRLTSPLPQGYRPGDLLIMAECDVSPFASGLSRLASAAVGVACEEGTAEGVLPVITNSMREPRGSVSVRTKDGLWGLRARIEEGLDNGKVCVLDGALAPTGNIRIRTDPPEAIGWPNLRATIVFSLRTPGGDRADPGLLSSPEEGVIEIAGVPPGDWTVGAEPPGPDGKRKPEFHVPLQAVRSTREAEPIPTTVRVMRWN